MKLRCSILLCFIFFTSVVRGQKESRNIICLAFGLSNFHILDEHASPLIYNGNGIAPNIYYTHKGSRLFHSVSLGYYYDNLFTTSDNFKTENFRAEFRYGLMTPVIERQKLSFFLGGSLSSFYCKSDYYFFLNTFWGRNISSWYWNHSIEVSAKIVYQLSDFDRINLQMYVPLICNISRPDYSPSGDYDYSTNEWIVEPFGKTEMLKNYTIVHTDISYERLVTSRISLNLLYSFSYSKYVKPSPIKMYMNNIRVGITYSL